MSLLKLLILMLLAGLVMYFDLARHSRHPK